MKGAWSSCGNNKGVWTQGQILTPKIYVRRNVRDLAFLSESTDTVLLMEIVSAFSIIQAYRAKRYSMHILHATLDCSVQLRKSRCVSSPTNDPNALPIILQTVSGQVCFNRVGGVTQLPLARNTVLPAKYRCDAIQLGIQLG